MLNNQNDKYEDHEESEYHFTDDEVSYEIDNEPTEPVTTPNNEKKGFNLSGNRKRMLIGGIIFFIVLLIIYKMIAPSTTPPSTEIATGASSTPQAQTRSEVVANLPSNATPQTNVPPVMPVENNAVTNPTANSNTQNINVPVTMPTTGVNQEQQGLQNSQGSNGAQVANQNETNNVGANASTVSEPANTQVSAEKLISQFQIDYASKLNDYANQNKALQDEVKVLTARIAVMETQMNQLIQTLTRATIAQQPPVNNTQQPVNAAPQPVQPTESKTSYSVQAIIPGRAWLRSENGETITVAEGEIIKDLGKVTKIDPYDGVVEINTGNKLISLSYGSGG